MNRDPVSFQPAVRGQYIDVETHRSQVTSSYDRQEKWFQKVTFAEAQRLHQNWVEKI